MKRIILLTLLLFLPIFSFGQKTKIIDKNGRFLTETGSIKSISEQFFNNERVYPHSVFENGIIIIGFKEFTNEVLFIALDGEPTNDQIQSAIKSFSLQDYFSSISFKLDLKKRIDDVNFTPKKATEYFGNPKNITETKDSTTLYYSFPNLTLLFSNGVLIDYILNK